MIAGGELYVFGESKSSWKKFGVGDVIVIQVFLNWEISCSKNRVRCRVVQVHMGLQIRFYKNEELICWINGISKPMRPCAKIGSGISLRLHPAKVILAIS